MTARGPARRAAAVLTPAALLVGSASVATAQAAAAPLMRYPNASATHVAFVARGDLWIAPLAGGTARRLTTDSGAVVAPRFSPDGRWIAFTGRRAGRRDVYVIPSAGGAVRRLTFDASPNSADNLVVTWTPDAQRVVFLSERSAHAFQQTRAYAVPVGGGPAEPLPLDRSGLLSYAPDGRAIAYNRGFRNFELRKRYIGGQAQDVYTYNFASKRLTRVTRWKGTDTFPMWYGRKLYFVSDRGPGLRANIWCYDFGTHGTHQVTDFADFDVDYPSLGGRAITFQQGGRLFAVDLPGETLREIAVDVPDDGARTAPRVAAVGSSARVTDAAGGVDYALSPRGDALLVSARGDLFAVAPSGAGENLTRTSGADEDHPAWSPDGRTIAYVTDADGEQQVAVRPAAGGAERRLTHSRSGYYYTPLWSPGGDQLAVADAQHGLWLISMGAAGAAPRRIAQDPRAEIRDAVFSPDGRWLAYSTVRPTRQRAIHLYSVAAGRDAVVSSPMESDRLPAFSADGRLLLFVSQRHELPFVSDRGDESLIATLNSDGLYAAPLDPRDGAPGAPASGAVDLDGLMSRAAALPVTPAVITSLEVRGSQLFYETRPPQLIDGDLPGQTSALHAFDLGTRADRVVVAGLDTHSLSADGTTVAFRRRGAWHIAGTRPAADTAPGGGANKGTGPGAPLDLGALRAEVDPRREWAEMFENAWRLDRDVFFSAAMNGTNWRAVHDAYARLLPRLGSQDDFAYLVGEMHGELASSHARFRAADPDRRAPVATAKLGADYALDAASGRYRFAHIYAGDNTRPQFRSPLHQPGLDLHDGDYLLAVNGRELRAPADPSSLLAGAQGRVTLTVAPSAAGPRRDVAVLPVDDEQPLRQADWVRHTRERVAALSGGRLGYVYLSDFYADGSADFVRQFYPQLDRDGLIFDVRWNRGGFTSQAVLDVLRRARAGAFVNREGAVAALPVATAPRAMVTLINEVTRSDGDQFAYYFRAFGLGPLVGTRTWGGVQGVNGPWRLLDGSALTIPKDALAGVDGRWLIENEGVAPDVDVDGRPDEMLGGHDSQLERAVAVALEQLERSPAAHLRTPRPLPAYPAGGDVPGARFGAACAAGTPACPKAPTGQR